MTDQTSLQRTLKAGDSFLPSTFLSNSLASIAQAFHTGTQGDIWGTVKNAWSAFSSNIVTGAAKYVPNPVAIIPVATAQTSLSITVQGSPVLEASVSTTVSEIAPMFPMGTVAQTAANAINYFNLPKITYDGAAAIGSALVCGGSPKRY
jgi:hypothetical protein